MGGKKNLAEVKIQSAIFQGDSLAPLLFVTAIMPLNYVLRKCIKLGGGLRIYKITRSIALWMK